MPEINTDKRFNCYPDYRQFKLAPTIALLGQQFTLCKRSGSDDNTKPI